MTFETVISPVLDKHINTNINESPVWKKAYKVEELNEKIRGMHPAWYEYTVKFDGLQPLMMTKFKEI